MFNLYFYRKIENYIKLFRILLTYVVNQCDFFNFQIFRADENVKKMFSLSFARRREGRLAAQYELMKSVQQNKYDFESYEVLRK